MMRYKLLIIKSKTWYFNSSGNIKLNELISVSIICYKNNPSKNQW